VGGRGGGLVVPATNRLPEPTDVDVTVDLKALGLAGKGVTAVNELTGKPLDLKDGTFTVSVQDRNYTFVSLGACPSNPIPT
jgi:hypothetical protein